MCALRAQQAVSVTACAPTAPTAARCRQSGGKRNPDPVTVRSAEGNSFATYKNKADADKAIAQNGGRIVAIGGRLVDAKSNPTIAVRMNGAEPANNGSGELRGPSEANLEYAARRSRYWGAFFGGEYSVMDPDGLAGHQHGENFGLAVDPAAIAAPFFKGLTVLRGLRVVPG